jgi:Cof subfamily protein (haloacid dehalogenase superfamily)
MSADAELDEALARVRLCVLDVDGTLVDSRHRVSPGTRAAVRRARDAGLTLLLATSRGPSALRPVLAEVDGLAGQVFVASQGALLGRYLGERLDVLERSPAPRDDALAVVERAEAGALSVSWYVGEQWLVGRVDELVEREARITGANPEVAVLAEQSAGPDKLMLVAPDDARARLAELAAALPATLQGQISNPTYLEVTAKGVDKAVTVSRFRAREGFAASEVLAVGDGPNDLPLFAVAAVTAAPANARAEVLASARVVVPSNDDDGVAALLDRVVRAQVRDGPR